MNVRRTPRRVSAALLFAATTLCGCGGADAIPYAARRALEDPQKLELLSLRPSHHEAEPDPPNPFRGWETLGSVDIKDPATRTRVADAFLKGADENDGEVASCFEPRHALRVTRGGRTFDFVICFECLQAAVYEGETEVGHFLISESPHPVFDEVLMAAGVELAPSAFAEPDAAEAADSTDSAVPPK